jgi:predicted nucleic acid-binding protein
MRLVHLDTNFTIRAFTRGTREDALLSDWVVARIEIRICIVAWTELLCGPIRINDSHDATGIIGPPILLAEEDASRAAELFNLGGRRRGSLPDCLVAAVALRAGATLATNNVTDFKRFESAGLKLATP